MSEQVEIRGTKWKLCSDGVWRTDKEFWGTPITDAIDEVIALRKRIAEVESDRDGWRSDCQRQGERAELWRRYAEQHMPKARYMKVIGQKMEHP